MAWLEKSAFSHIAHTYTPLYGLIPVLSNYQPGKPFLIPGFVEARFQSLQRHISTLKLKVQPNRYPSSLLRLGLLQ
jgi:hypothetical protein